MIKAINAILRPSGYELRKIEAPTKTKESEQPKESGRYVIFEYRKSDGSFDYDHYRRVQREGNLRKLDQTWVIEANIKFLARYLQTELGQIKFGICHGTRRGNEQRWFREALQCDVIGTEISDSATEFPHTVQWDFHKENPDWLAKVDFIYSNSFDHSYDPEKCLNTWIDSLRIGGLCILEHSNLHAPEGVTELDPFGAEMEIMPFLIARWAKGRFFLKEILEAPQKRPSLKSLSFLVIQRAK